MAKSELEMTNASSSEDEQGSTEVESSGSESESEMTAPNTKTPVLTKQQSSSSEAESESESESESEADSLPNNSENAEPNTKTPVSKPILSQTPTQKSPNSHSPPQAAEDTGKKKRKAAEVVGDEATESKFSKTAAGEKKATNTFQRVWREEDEILLIERMFFYSEKEGKDPTTKSNADDFYKFVKKSITFDFSNEQMKAKFKRLKEKFRNNVDRLEKGKVNSLGNPHQKKMFELSNKLWGGKRNINAEADQKLKGPVVVSCEAKVNGGVDSVVHYSRGGGIKIPITDEDIMNRGLELASGVKKLELEKNWNDLKVEELKLYVKRLGLLKEQGELVLAAASNKSGAS